MEHNPWKTLSQKQVYSNPWISVSHREVLNPAGNPGIYGVVQFQNYAVGIIPIDEAGNTWLVGQYRYTLEQYSWEIPEGGCPLGEDVLAAAKRELLEETGITAQQWTPILEADMSNSVTDERAYVFVATQLSFGEAQPEETEDLRVKKLPLEEAIQMALDGRMRDALAMLALLKVKAMLDASEPLTPRSP
ncbi:MAG: NUDIX hydrolase [Bacteroidota bacterium]